MVALSPDKLSFRNRAPVSAWAVPLLASIALGGAMEPLQAEAQPLNHNQDQLIPLRDTYGYNYKLWDIDRKQLKQATVKVLSKDTYRVFDRGYDDPCTGIKVDIDGQEVISTAAHCFKDTTGDHNGTLNPTNFLQADPNSKAFNITALPKTRYTKPSMKSELEPVSLNKSTLKYVVSKPPKKHNFKVRSMTRIDQVAVSTQNADQALMSLKPLPDGAKPNKLRQAQPLTFASSKSQPYQGEQVGLYNSPSFNQDVPIESTGRYIGRLTYTRTGEKVDLVAVKKRAQCMFGASGSSFIASYSTTNQRFVSGPLAERQDVKFNPALITDLSEAPYQQQYDEGVKDAGKAKSAYEKLFGVSLDGQSTICKYTVPRSKIIKPILKALEQSNS